MSKYDIEQAKRDLNPHQEAALAMAIYGREYSQQKLGCMGFWDSLNNPRKNFVRDVAQRMRNCPPEDSPTPMNHQEERE